MSIPVESFTVCDGSMTSEDGQTFYLHAKRDDGSGVMLAFPHEELPSIIECAAMQMDKGKNMEAGKMISAFEAIGFSIGQGPEGQTVLGMSMNEGAKINFLLDPELIDELLTALGRTRVKH